MKKEALINKLGFQATQRVIRRTNSQRKPHPCPSSPQTWCNGTIGKWLELADEEDEDENHVHLAQLLIGRLIYKASSGCQSKLRRAPGVHYHTPIHYSHQMFSSSTTNAPSFTRKI
ncbi:hypothetical protein VP01_13759g1 [Puccinia sorghi]|uniref:Uncharacterized protein n=1 Tax=Puccinia sorghi TaxID=27349 RepID=A0A0L6VLR4_9BASI|nr:hypothetical protein VP01_13759g1 [Puccinia sorghi]